MLSLLAFLRRYGYYAVALVLVLLLVLGTERCQRQAYEAKLLELARLNEALSDSMHTTRQANGTLTHEKKTLQASLGTLREQNALLNQEQRALVAKVTELNKKPRRQGRVITAGSITYDTGIKKPLPSVPAQATDSADVVDFTYSSDSISYRARLRGVRIDSTSKPTLQLTNVKLPNVATVVFAWGSKKDGSPVSFSVHNSNPLFNVSSVESYAIPELRPEIQEKTRVGKILQGLGRVGKYVIPVAAAAAGGYVLGRGH